MICCFIDLLSFPPGFIKHLLLNDLSSVHLAAASRKLLNKGNQNSIDLNFYLKVPLDMSTDETLAGPLGLKVHCLPLSSKFCAPLVEDLLEALVAGHLHAQLHHLVNLLRLVLAPDHQHNRLQLGGHLLVHQGVLSPLFHHLGGTGSNRLLSDGLSHAGRNRRRGEYLNHPSFPSTRS